MSDKSLFHCGECEFTTADEGRANDHMHTTTHSMVLSDSWRKPAAPTEVPKVQEPRQPIICGNCGPTSFKIDFEATQGLILKCTICGEQKLIETPVAAPSAPQKAEVFFSQSGPHEFKQMAYGFTDAQREIIFKFAEAYASFLMQPCTAPITPWKCFHCEFETCDKAQAEAHFGGGEGDPAICLYWTRLSVEDRLDEFQTMMQQLNLERDDNGVLVARAEAAEAEVLRLRNALEIAVDGFDPIDADMDKLAEKYDSGGEPEYPNDLLHDMARSIQHHIMGVKILLEETLGGDPMAGLKKLNETLAALSPGAAQEGER